MKIKFDEIINNNDNFNIDILVDQLNLGYHDKYNKPDEIDWKSNRPNLKYYNKDYNNISNEIINKGYYVVKNFINKEEINYLKNIEKNKKMYPENNNKNNFEKKSWEANNKYENTNIYNGENGCLFQFDINDNSKLGIIIKNMFILRTLIEFQPAFDLFKFSQIFDNDECKITKDPLKYNSEITFWRFMNYQNNYIKPEHVDRPGELMCILFLTSYGKDFTNGLHGTKYWENNYIDLDKDTVAGDLLIVDGYRISHCIGPVNVNDNQEGRITIFLPGNPGKIRDSLKSFKDFL